ncbi:MAG: glycoside hydrolase family 5 protein [Ruminococcaceae bacterium]|nr:glycoside hydrolase family 5 protein [Oscillospiraceae bacterium]
MDTIKVQGMKFVDSYGRERIFNGMNVCDKTNYIPGFVANEFSKDLFWVDEFKKLGFNIIRLGMTWSVVEPEKGKYNEEYLNSIEKIMDCCHEKGIYVYLDMHQDLFCNKTGAGDGAPDWAIDAGPYKFQKTKIVWAEGYFWGRAVHRAFDNFWTNKKIDNDGLLDCFADMWGHVADRFKDHPALFGFDVFNEPFPGKDGGKVFRKIIGKLARVTLVDKRLSRCKLLKDALGKEKIKVLDHYTGDIFHTIVCAGEKLINKFDTERYMPFLNKTASKIRESTDKGVLFIENSYYSNLGIPCLNTPIEVNGKREPQQCFSPHGYDLMVDTPLYKYASNSRVESIFGQHRVTQERMQNPVLVGEWGGHSEGTEWFPHVEYLIDMFNRYKWSATYWAYWKELLDEEVMTILSRPYPKAVTGDIKEFCHDRKNNEFVLTYNQNKNYDVPTVIFAHKKVKEIIADGETKIIPITDSACDIEIVSGIGEHTVKVVFED